MSPRREVRQLWNYQKYFEPHQILLLLDVLSLTAPVASSLVVLRLATVCHEGLCKHHVDIVHGRVR